MMSWHVMPSTPGAPLLASTSHHAVSQHVVPVDPVIQGVKPELRLLLGLLTQLPSQFRDFRRQRDPGLLLWLSQLLDPSSGHRFLP